MSNIKKATLATKQTWFITGTDTGIGKTFSTCALLHLCKNRGLKAVGLKPVAAGISSSGYNEDTEQLQSASTLAITKQEITPYLLKQAIAPKIAISLEKTCIDFEYIKSQCEIWKQQADIVFIEGVGGFKVPLGQDSSGKNQDTSQLAAELKAPVILVVGMRLGCQNHALLTADSIRQCGLNLAGWIANSGIPQAFENTPTQPMSYLTENIKCIEALIDAPLLGILPFCLEKQPEEAVQYLKLPCDL